MSTDSIDSTDSFARMYPLDSYLYDIDTHGVEGTTKVTVASTDEQKSLVWVNGVGRGLGRDLQQCRDTRVDARFVTTNDRGAQFYDDISSSAARPPTRARR